MSLTKEIIELIHKGEYDTCITDFKIECSQNKSKLYAVLEYFVTPDNMDFINELCEGYDLSRIVITILISNSTLYPFLENLFRTNIITLNIFESISGCVYNEIMDKSNMQLLDMIITYMPSSNNLKYIFYGALEDNNIYILDTLFERNYDIKLEFDKKMTHRKQNPVMEDYEQELKFITFMHLVKYGVDVFSYVDVMSMVFYYKNDIDGLKFCLENNSDTKYILDNLYYCPNIVITQCLLDYGVEINRLKFEQIKSIIGNWDDDLQLIIYLVENGLNIWDYMNNILIYIIECGHNIILEYFISLDVDINFRNGELLFVAYQKGSIECLKMLLKNNINIGSDNYISKFIALELSKYSSYHNWIAIVKILLDHGIIIDDPYNIFCWYVSNIQKCGFDLELLTLILNCGIDLDNKMHSSPVLSFKKFYILEIIVSLGELELFNLCLKYGADPFINDHSPLKLAIKSNKTAIVKILLDLGSIVDINLTYEVEQEIIDLLDTYHIAHNLKKLIK